MECRFLIRSRDAERTERPIQRHREKTLGANPTQHRQPRGAAGERPDAGAGSRPAALVQSCARRFLRQTGDKLEENVDGWRGAEMADTWQLWCGGREEAPHMGKSGETGQLSGYSTIPNTHTQQTSESWVLSQVHVSQSSRSGTEVEGADPRQVTREMDRGHHGTSDASGSHRPIKRLAAWARTETHGQVYKEFFHIEQ